RRLAGGDNAADRVHVQLMHHSALRCPNVDAHELVFGGDLAFHQLGPLALDLAQLLGYLASEILIDLGDLELGHRDLGSRLRHRRRELAVLALDPHRFALELGQTHDGDEVLFPQISDSLELAADQLRLPLLGLGLLYQALDFLPELPDPLVELRLLAGARGLAQVEQLPLAVDDTAAVGIADAGGQLVGKPRLAFVVALGLQAVVAGRKFVDALDDDGEVRARHRRVEADDHVAGVPPRSVSDAKLADAPAGRVLDLLYIGIDDHVAGRHHGAGQLRHGSPSTEAACDENPDRHRRKDMASDRTTRAVACRTHGFTSPSAGFTERKWGLARSSTFCSTSSFGPNVCARPLAMARSRSTPSRADGRWAMTITTAPRSRAPSMACVSASSPSASR